jgi:hypothetical protein
LSEMVWFRQLRIARRTAGEMRGNPAMRPSSRFAGEVDVVRLFCPFEALLLSTEPVLFVLAGFAAAAFI